MLNFKQPVLISSKSKYPNSKLTIWHARGMGYVGYMNLAAPGEKFPQKPNKGAKQQIFALVPMWKSS
jgi:hypothetical protein